MTQFTHAIVTGGSSGIGKETARLLLQRGTRVTLIARRPDVLATACAELVREQRGPAQSVFGISADVQDPKAVHDAIAQARVRFGPCDLLVTSAGIAHPGYFSEIPSNVFEETMSINYFGTLYPIREVVPEMRARRCGHIVMISSGAGIVGIFGYSAYSPSKFALRGLAEVLRSELVQDGIGVSIVYPPDTDTPQLVAENLIKPVETKAVAAGAKTWRADDVAKCILKGVDRGRFAITPGWEMALLYKIHSLANPVLAWSFDRIAARARKRSFPSG